MVIPKTWKKGMTQTTPALGSSLARIHAMVCATLASRLRWDNITPLGVPVAPLVYCSTASSSARHHHLRRG